MTTEKKKVSLKEAIQQKLANKKQDQKNSLENAKAGESGTKKLQHQQSKKNTIQHRKMGG